MTKHCFRRLNNEFLCKDNSCVRNRPNSKYDASNWIDTTNDGLDSNPIACNEVAECSDGSDESRIYAGCGKQNGACMSFYANRYICHNCK